MAGGVLFVQVGSDPAGGRVLALDPATGDEIWSWSGVGPGYASPIAIEVERQRQLVTLTDGRMASGMASSQRGLAGTGLPGEPLLGLADGRLVGGHLAATG